MTPAFLNNKQLKKKYLDIMMSWQGTPYRHLVCSKGRGADCTLLVGACLKELGVLKKVEHDYYPRNWHMNTTREWVVESFYHHIKNHLNKQWALIWKTCSPGEIKKEKFLFGDVLTFATTKMKVSNHCGIWLNDGLKFFNSINVRGCCVLTYGSFWERRLTGVLRIYRVED